MMEPETAITLVAHCGHIVIVVVSSEHEDYVNRTATTQLIDLAVITFDQTILIGPESNHGIGYLSNSLSAVQLTSVM